MTNIPTPLIAANQTTGATPTRHESAELSSALNAVENLDGLPIAEHVAAFETVHQLLQEHLAEAAADG